MKKEIEVKQTAQAGIIIDYKGGAWRYIEVNGVRYVSFIAYEVLHAALYYAREELEAERQAFDETKAALQDVTCEGRKKCINPRVEALRERLGDEREARAFKERALLAEVKAHAETKAALGRDYNVVTNALLDERKKREEDRDEIEVLERDLKHERAAHAETKNVESNVRFGFDRINQDLFDEHKAHAETKAALSRSHALMRRVCDNGALWHKHEARDLHNEMERLLGPKAKPDRSCKTCSRPVYCPIREALGVVTACSKWDKREEEPAKPVRPCATCAYRLPKTCAQRECGGQSKELECCRVGYSSALNTKNDCAGWRRTEK